jgi:hypothetical protein
MTSTVDKNSSRGLISVSTDKGTALSIELTIRIEQRKLRKTPRLWFELVSPSGVLDRNRMGLVLKKLVELRRFSFL